MTARAELTHTPCAHTHTLTHASSRLSSDKGPQWVCMCVAARGIALAKYNICQQVKSYLIEPKKPCEASLPYSIVFASQNRARQNDSTELSFHTVTACCRLLDSIKTSQIHSHSCSVYLLQWKPNTAVLTQMYTENATCLPLLLQDTVLHHY